MLSLLLVSPATRYSVVEVTAVHGAVIGPDEPWMSSTTESPDPSARTRAAAIPRARAPGRATIGTPGTTTKCSVVGPPLVEEKVIAAWTGRLAVFVSSIEDDTLGSPTGSGPAHDHWVELAPGTPRTALASPAVVRPELGARTATLARPPSAKAPASEETSVTRRLGEGFTTVNSALQPRRARARAQPRRASSVARKRAPGGREPCSGVGR